MITVEKNKLDVVVVREGPAGPPGGIAALIMQSDDPGDPSVIDVGKLARYPLWIDTDENIGDSGFGGGSQVLVVPSLDAVPSGTPAGTVVVVSASAPPPPGSTPSVVSYTKGGVSGTTLTLSKPSGLQEGDWLFVFVAHQGSTAVTGFTPEAGFSQAAWGFAAPAPTDSRVNYVLKKFVADPAAEPASYSFTVLGGGTQRGVAIMLAIRGAAETSPVSAYSGPVSGTNTAPEIPSVTVPDDNSLAIGLIHTTCTATPDTSHTAPQWSLAVTRDHPEGSSATASTTRLSLFVRSVSTGLLAETVATAAGGAAVSTDAAAVLVIRP
jgi:hypothetical protein